MRKALYILAGLVLFLLPAACNNTPCNQKGEETENEEVRLPKQSTEFVGEENASNGLRIELEAETRKFHLGQAVYIQVNLCNESDHPLHLFGTWTPYERTDIGLDISDIHLEVTCAGKALPIMRPASNEGDNTGGMSLKPGKETGYPFYVSKWCDCSKPGIYTVRMQYVREKSPFGWWGKTTSNKVSVEVLDK